MPPRRAPAVASDPAIVHAAYVQAGSVRKAAALLGIAKSVVSDALLGKSKSLSDTNAEKAGRSVANADRQLRRELVGTANVLRERARGDPTRLGAERVNLALHTPAERRQVVREQERRQTAAAAAYQRFLASQRDRRKSPDRRPRLGTPPEQPSEPLFGRDEDEILEDEEQERADRESPEPAETPPARPPRRPRRTRRAP